MKIVALLTPQPGLTLLGIHLLDEKRKQDDPTVAKDALTPGRFYQPGWLQTLPYRKRVSCPRLANKKM